jgi:hypothetical protein
MGVKAIEWFRDLGIEVATATRQGMGATLDAYLAGAVTGVTECNHDHCATRFFSLFPQENHP